MRIFHLFLVTFPNYECAEMKACAPCICYNNILDCYGREVYFFPDLHPGIKETIIAISITTTAIDRLPPVKNEEYVALQRFGEGANYYLECDSVLDWYFELNAVAFTSDCNLPPRLTSYYYTEPTDDDTVTQPPTTRTLSNISSSVPSTTASLSDESTYTGDTTLSIAINTSTDVPPTIPDDVPHKQSLIAVIGLCVSLLTFIILAGYKTYAHVTQKRVSSRPIEPLQLDDFELDENVIYSRDSVSVV